MISTMGGKVASNQIVHNVPLSLGSKTVPTTLILLPLEGMDIILGMDWMKRHRVLLDISSRAVQKILQLMVIRFYIYLIPNATTFVPMP